MKLGWTLVGLGILFLLAMILDWTLMGSYGRSWFLEWITDGSIFTHWSYFLEEFRFNLLWSGGCLLLAVISFFFGIRKVMGSRVVTVEERNN